MTTKTFLAPALAALILSGCQMTGDPMTDRAAVGAAGGAVIGNLLGGDSEATLAGALLGGAAGAASAAGQRPQPVARQSAHPCADLIAKYGRSETTADLCDQRLSAAY